MTQSTSQTKENLEAELKQKEVELQEAIEAQDPKWMEEVQEEIDQLDSELQA